MKTNIKINSNWEAQRAIATYADNTLITNWTVRILTFLQNIFLTGVMVVAATSFAFAQNGKLYLKGETKINTAIDMVTGQYGNGTNNTKHTAPAKTKNETRKADVKNPAHTVSATTAAFGDDKYLKTKEEGKMYTEFKVMDVKGMDKEEVMRGMMTGSLDRDTRYNDKGAVATKTSISVINGTVAQKDANGNVARNAEKVNVSAITFKDKVFVIAGKNDYRYMDGKTLTGGQKLIDELMKGKPVTESTFYFQLKNAGIITDGTTLTQFSKMDLNQQQLMLNGVALAAAF